MRLWLRLVGYTLLLGTSWSITSRVGTLLLAKEGALLFVALVLACLAFDAWILAGVIRCAPRRWGPASAAVTGLATLIWLGLQHGLLRNASGSAALLSIPMLGEVLASSAFGGLMVAGAVRAVLIRLGQIAGPPETSELPRPDRDT